MKYAETVLDLVGDTPLVKLNRVTDGIQATVLVKVEYVNPGGSSKDRIAQRIIDAAEREGKLKPGGTIVEPTSGNTGIGLALVAQQRGYRCVFVCPDKVSEDKINTLKAYGAEVVVCPTSVAPESPESYYSVSDRLSKEIPGAFKPDQYSNPNGPLSHYETTGPEIWRDTDGKVTHYVAGVGTGGTISGAGKYLKEQNPAIRVIGADPEGSVYSGGSGRPYLVEGVGEDFWPTAYDPSLVDEIIASSDAESFEMTRRLAREEGLLVGGSSGLAVASGLKAARALGPDDVMVILLPDGGRGYLGKIFNDRWMRAHGFLPAEEERTVADLVATKSPELQGLAHVRRDATVRDAIDALRRLDVSQLLVLAAEPPVVMGEVVGAIDERVLIDAIASGRAAMTDAVDALVVPAFPLIGITDSIAAARDALTSADALLVTDLGKPVAVVTRHDLLAVLAE
ncbi:cystathionine beta-synthase [Homoserinibacter sp. GY 40078]|uniref:cystathionine beta-synthase n=1 Tax=Homoserinibacter sp. GY 40078 TaxID=2603275 RepID=UPI0011C83ACA|nr:cystathionine beta-synthase [Homoserinibacter sp. GY 40078]TXK18502.1 cystathionine beta-synthase [Homoserinibacter sp. GY 40078]